VKLKSIVLGVVGTWIAAITGVQSFSLLGSETLLNKPASWAVYYGPVPNLKVSVPARLKAQWLVLEPDHPWELKKVRQDKQLIFAYLSLGEVNKTRPYFKRIQHAIALQNPNWPDGYMLNPGAAEWRELVLEELIPGFIAKGYDGLFFDTLDNAGFLETKGITGARNNLGRLITDIHTRFPHLKLLGNGGIDLLPQVGSQLAGLCVESVYSDYRFNPPTYRLREEKSANMKGDDLKAISERYQLPVFVIEYVDDKQKDMITTVKQKLHDAGFIPFLSDIGLSRLDLNYDH
jgi:polysaccharide biosynthesis protein PelA